MEKFLKEIKKEILEKSLMMDFDNWEFGLEKDFVEKLTDVEVTEVMIKFLEKDEKGYLDLIDKLKRKYDNAERGISKGSR